jgi:hypothetical protein
MLATYVFALQVALSSPARPEDAEYVFSSAYRFTIHANPGIGPAFCQSQPIRPRAGSFPSSSVIGILSNPACRSSGNSFESRNRAASTALINTYSTSTSNSENPFESWNRTFSTTLTNTYSTSTNSSDGIFKSRNCTFSATLINTYSTSTNSYDWIFEPRNRSVLTSLSTIVPTGPGHTNTGSTWTPNEINIT